MFFDDAPRLAAVERRGDDSRRPCLGRPVKLLNLLEYALVVGVLAAVVLSGRMLL